MKKLMISLLVMAAAMNVFALPQIKGKATITLTSKSGYNATLTLTMSDDFTDGVNKGYCSLDYTDGKVVDIYALYGGQKYSTFGTKDWENVEIGITPADADANYTLSFSNVSGDPIKFYDEKGNMIEAKEDETYEFSVTPGAAGYLSKLNFSMVAPALTPAICHQNGRLEITAYQGASVKVLAYDDESEVIAATDITEAYKEIDLKDLAAGQYIVVLTTADGDQRLVIKK